MASTFNAVICAIAAAVLWGAIGLPLARRIMPMPLAWSIAPICGFAAHSAVMLPLCMLVGLNHLVAVVGFGAALLLAAVLPAASPAPSPTPDAGAIIPTWSFVAAAAAIAAVALIPLWAILPKPVADGVVLAAPIYDHSKIAIVNEIVRAGVPAANPFFGENGEPGRLPYYYLWHFAAAELALALGGSGWEADAGLTGFTAFAALALAAGLAVWLSGRASAAFWAILLTLPGSLRTAIEALSPTGAPQPALSWTPGLSGLLFQASWAPQHVAAACCVVLAVAAMARLAQRPSLPLLAGLGLLAAAGFGASTWVGGILFALAAPVVALVLLVRMPPGRRAGFLLRCGLAAALALALASPLLREQYAAAMLRDGPPPLAVSPYEVLGVWFPQGIRRVLDLPAFWAVLLPLEFPAIYPPGLAGLASLLAAGGLAAERRWWLPAAAALGLVSLLSAWLLVSTVGDNNDFGWRAVLPALLILTAGAAAGLAQWSARGLRGRVAAACCAAALGLPAGLTLAHDNVAGQPAAAPRALAPLFAQEPAMWAAVRHYAGPADRVGNNPLSLRAMTPWPINIAWALLADRRSCFAGLEFATVFVPLPIGVRGEANQQVNRVFDGSGTADDVRDLATRYGCAVIVVTAQDGAWSRDPFAASPYYRLVNTAPERWRIYRATIAGPDRVVEDRKPIPIL